MQSPLSRPQWRTPLRGTFCCSLVFLIDFLHLSFCPFKALFILHCPDKVSTPFSFLPNPTLGAPYLTKCPRSQQCSSLTLTSSRCSRGLIYQLACQSRQYFLSFIVTPSIPSPGKRNGLLLQRYLHTGVRIRRKAAPLCSSRLQRLSECSETHVLLARSMFLMRMVGLNYWQLKEGSK